MVVLPNNAIPANIERRMLATRSITFFLVQSQLFGKFGSGH